MSASSKRLSFVGALISAAALPLLVTGCTVTPTVSPENVAEAAADALENEVGQRPTIDCGDEAIPLEEGTEITCDLIDEATGDIYDTSVTLSDIKDGRYHVAVKVADHKRADD
ncbi:DUF4333 domain-containing protein [Microbacterium sp. MPKO10]|uniref:DUF4333 domain-containing protein n=1 Tax=Microbacterium sp. MPKO10 TaxID=2989818 RepID=UPI0022365D72|nr:DUF4333 domain-containing protein [Microbacterium sp. MPKO10]MCW4457151.1 DUF4333 domain-containing protein [Microbacterium sp. MPKO10]